MVSISEFNNCLPAFNTLLINNINVPVTNNYVRNSRLGKYIVVILTISEGSLTVTVSYDSFYQVPVLFFLKNNQLDRHSKSMVEIHPILQTPYQMVHPCETQDIMDSLASQSGLEYLSRWFGIHIGEVCGEIELRVPTDQLKTMSETLDGSE